MAFAGSYAAGILLLARSPFATEDYLYKFLFLTLLVAGAVAICFCHRDLKRDPRARALMLVIFSLAIAGTIAWSQLVGVPEDNSPIPAPDEGAGDPQRYEYWGMYVAEGWRSGAYDFPLIPLSRPAIVYLWAAVYFLFGPDPHLTVMLNGFLFALVVLVTYQSGLRFSGRDTGWRAMLLSVAMAEGFLWSAMSGKDTLIALLFIYGLYRAWLLLDGAKLSGLAAVAGSTVGLIFFRPPMAFLLLLCFATGLVIERHLSLSRRVVIAALAVVAVVVPLRWESNLASAVRGYGVVDDFASFLSPALLDPDVGTALGAVERMVTVTGISFLYLPLHMLAILMDGSINMLWQLDRVVQRFEYVVAFASAIVIALLLPSVVAAIFGCAREQSQARLYALSFLIGLAGLAYWLSGVVYMRQRLFLLPVYAVLAAHQMEAVSQRIRSRLWVLGGLLLVGGSAAYGYLMRG